ncbi:S8 family serine peptidase [Paenibacillus popilliae]|uniref:Subtilisin-like serine protease n=1 Tax=Paenibacillus popilliae ATCC 14706 TaxID=1212764 RepID=M9M3W5_PAEPP|nr:S8 family serine peptidase [Paenibacillus popilliae]GAC43734.1 subtilisin-like serine protease [Paenibacillus popilliae ATCC 14706]
MTDFRIPKYEVLAQEETIHEMPVGVQMIKAEQIWQESRKGEDVVVAVIDSGCNVQHADLSSNIVATRNFVASEGGDSDVTDFSGHGTHVAGTIAAVENGNGVIGVALVAKVMQRINSWRRAIRRAFCCWSCSRVRDSDSFFIKERFVRRAEKSCWKTD